MADTYMKPMKLINQVKAEDGTEARVLLNEDTKMYFVELKQEYEDSWECVALCEDEGWAEDIMILVSENPGV